MNEESRREEGRKRGGMERKARRRTDRITIEEKTEEIVYNDRKYARK